MIRETLKGEDGTGKKGEKRKPKMKEEGKTKTPICNR